MSLGDRKEHFSQGDLWADEAWETKVSNTEHLSYNEGNRQHEVLELLGSSALKLASLAFHPAHLHTGLLEQAIFTLYVMTLLLPMLPSNHTAWRMTVQLVNEGHI